MFKHSIFDITCFKGKKVLDFGCGRNKLPGAVGLDHMPLPGVDIVCDLNGRLPFEDNEFEVVYSNQVFEHITNVIGLIEELYRILVPGGILVAYVPYFRSSWAAVDPTHCRNYTLNSMDYFVKGNFFSDGYRFSDVSFSSIVKYIDGNYPPSILRWFFTKLALKWPNRFENSVLSFIYPFQTLTYVLTK